MTVLSPPGRPHYDDGVPDWTDNVYFIAPRSRTALREKNADSPYFGVRDGDRQEVTRQLLSAHPLTGLDLARAVTQAWDDIFDSRIGLGQIGTDIFPDPQIMGYLLHELIPIRVSAAFRGWRKDRDKWEKDLEFDPDSRYSTEIKTSSNPTQIFGNRSYGIETADPSRKAKSGYYLAVNFERWVDAPPGLRPAIRLIRFGWIDSTDWKAQAAQSGQNSSLPGGVYAEQLAVIYEAI